MKKLCSLALVLQLSGCAGESDAPPQVEVEPTNLILITLDTLRADKLSCYGYPRATTPQLDRIAREGTLFLEAYAPVALTLPSHVSMMTGLWPLEHGITLNLEEGGRTFGWKESVTPFAVMAREAGYGTAAFVSATPLKRSSGIDAGFDVYLQPEGGEEIAGVTLMRATRWLKQNAEEPFFLWVHLFDPHWPYSPPPSYDNYEEDQLLEEWLAARAFPEVLSLAGGEEQYETARAHNHYDAEVRYLDDQLGIFFRTLRQRGLMNRSVLAIAADHGEGLNQHDWNRHHRVHEEQLRVPMMIRLPGGRGELSGRVTSPVATTDILPSVLPHVHPGLAARFAQQASGVDVLDPAYAGRELLGIRLASTGIDGVGHLYSLTTERWKLLHDPNGADELFDLDADPHELHDLAAEHPDVAAQLLARLEVLVARQERKAASLGPQGDGQLLDDSAMRELDQLGYGGDD